MNNSLIPICISICITVGYFKLMTTTAAEMAVARYIPNYNIFIFVFGICIFIISMIAVCYNRMINRVAKRNFLTIVLVFFGLFFLNDLFETSKTFKYENLEKYYYQINKFKLCFASCIGAIFLFYGIKKEIQLTNVSHKKIKRVAVFCSAMISIIITMTALFTPSIMMNRYQVVHNGEVFTQIYNIYLGEPFSRTQFGIYGHYAVFYWFLFRMIDFSMERFIIIQMVLGGLTVIFAVYCIYNRVNSVVVSTMSCACLSLLWGANMNAQLVTYQAIIREFPLTFMDAFIVFMGSNGFLNGRHRNQFVLFGYVLASFLVVWNTEMGIVASMGWACLCVLTEEQDIIISVKRLTYGKKMMLHFLAIIVTIGLAFFFTNGFNIYILQGHPLSLKTFFIPFTNNSFTTGLIIPLTGGNYPWMWIFVFGLVVLGIGVAKFFEKKMMIDDEVAVDTAISVTLLGGMIYFVNRACAGTLFVITFQAIIILAVILNYIVKYYQQVTRHLECNNLILSKRIIPEVVVAGCFLSCVGRF